MLRAYNLHCPLCNESMIHLPAQDPENPYCNECCEDVDIEDMTQRIEGWNEYLKDRKEYMEAIAQQTAQDKEDEDRKQ